MDSLQWLKNAALRTVRSISERRARPDDAFARDRLTPGEYRLYARMDARDRAHAVHVARVLLARHPAAPDRLVRAALLHDVGKSGRAYRLWERILTHLYAPGDVPAEPRLQGFRGAWQVRVHHARYGAELVRRAGESEAVAALIEAHHSPDAGPEARLLRQIDELT